MCSTLRLKACGDSRCNAITGAGGVCWMWRERERGRPGLFLGRTLLRTLRRFYRSVTHAALYAPLGIIMIIIALAIFNVLEAGNGSGYYGRSYNPPRSRYPPFKIRPFPTTTGYHLTLIAYRPNDPRPGTFPSLSKAILLKLSLFIQRVFCFEKNIFRR